MNGLWFSSKIFLGILSGGCQELAGCALIWGRLVQSYLKDLMSSTVQKIIRSEMVRLLFSVQKWAYINFVIKKKWIHYVDYSFTIDYLSVYEKVRFLKSILKSLKVDGLYGNMILEQEWGRKRRNTEGSQ